MSGLVATAAVLVTGIGMMLIIAGVLVAGVFLPGVSLLVAGLVAFAAAALVPLVRRSASASG